MNEISFELIPSLKKVVKERILWRGEEIFSKRMGRTFSPHPVTLLSRPSRHHPSSILISLPSCVLTLPLLPGTCFLALHKLSPFKDCL